MENNKFKCGFASIIGEPNVGKSTLLNSILNTKISITTAKPQTTRKKILGIYSDANSQIIFLDTPGLINPKYLLQEKMVEQIHSALEESEVIFAVCEVTRHSVDFFKEKILKLIQPLNIPVFLIINKIDTIAKEELPAIILELSSVFDFKEIFPVSARKKFNIKELIESTKNYLPEQQPFYPTDILSQEPERFFISEIIREKIFEIFSEEIPYSTEVIIADYKEREKGKDFISAEIFVERDNQRMIIIGEKGSAVKKIGERARADIEEFLGKKVYLELFVKVRGNWRNSEHYMKQFGYAKKS